MDECCYGSYKPEIPLLSYLSSLVNPEIHCTCTRRLCQLVMSSLSLWILWSLWSLCFQCCPVAPGTPPSVGQSSISSDHHSQHFCKSLKMLLINTYREVQSTRMSYRDTVAYLWGKSLRTVFTTHWNFAETEWLQMMLIVAPYRSTIEGGRAHCRCSEHFRLRGQECWSSLMSFCFL